MFHFFPAVTSFVKPTRCTKTNHINERRDNIGQWQFKQADVHPASHRKTIKVSFEATT